MNFGENVFLNVCAYVFLFWVIKAAFIQVICYVLLLKLTFHSNFIEFNKAINNYFHFTLSEFFTPASADGRSLNSLHLSRTLLSYLADAAIWMASILPLISVSSGPLFKPFGISYLFLFIYSFLYFISLLIFHTSIWWFSSSGVWATITLLMSSGLFWVI